MMKPIKEAGLSIEALWREVLLQALTDGLNSPPVSDAILGAGAEIPPRDYILVPNADFELVCQYAGADPDALRRDFQARLATRDPRGVHKTRDRRMSKKRAPKPPTTSICQERLLTLREWADRSGFSRKLLLDRVNRLGWSIERALTEPVGRRMPKPSRSDWAQVERILSRMSVPVSEGSAKTAG